jgi:hypothetical protein
MDKTFSIKFDSTMEEFIELHEKVWARAKSNRRKRITSSFAAAFFIGFPIFSICALYRTITEGLIFGLLFAGLGFRASYISFRLDAKKQLAEYFREQFGDRETIPFELEINSEGLRTNQLGIKSEYEWSHLEEIEETEKNVEFYLYGGNAIFVRKRAFKSAEDERQFLENVQQFIGYSRNASNWIRD